MWILLQDVVAKQPAENPWETRIIFIAIGIVQIGIGKYWQSGFEKIKSELINVLQTYKIETVQKLGEMQLSITKDLIPISERLIKVEQNEQEIVRLRDKIERLEFDAHSVRKFRDDPPRNPGA